MKLLVPDWKHGWKWLSVWLLTAEGAWLYALNHYEHAIVNILGAAWPDRISMGMVAAIFIARFLNQGGGDAE